MPSYDKNQMLDKFAETYGCLLSANIALPVPRINYAYLAIDNFLSAMLMNKGIEPSHNHATKIQQFNENFPEMLEHFPDLHQLDQHRKTWHKCRYENSEIEKADTKAIFNLAKLCYEIGINELCSMYDVDRYDLEQELRTKSEKKFYFVNLANALGSVRAQADQYVNEATDAKEAIKRLVTDFRNMIAIEATTDDEVVAEFLEKSDGVDLLDEIALFFSKYILLTISKRFSDRRIDNIDINDFRLRINLKFEGKDIEDIKQFITDEHIVRFLRKIDRREDEKN